MRSRTWVGCLTLVLLLLLSVRPCVAGYITLDVRPSAEFIEQFITVSASITNNGDEPAYKVQVSVEGEGRSVSLPAIDHIGINEQKKIVATLPVGTLTPGTYSTIIRTGYIDANGYHFSTVTVVSGSKWTNVISPVVAVLEVSELSQFSHLRVRVSNMGRRESDIRLRIASPEELSIDRPEIRLRLQGGQEEQVSFVVRNVSAIPGSSYAVYAILDSRMQDLHTSTAFAAQVPILARGGSSGFTPLLILVGLASLPLGVLVLFRLIFRVSLRFKTQQQRHVRPRRTLA